MPEEIAPGVLASAALIAASLASVSAVGAYCASARNRQITALLYREGAEFAGVRAIARVQFERYQVDSVADILHRHGMTGPALRDEAIQFVAMALGEWQLRLLFGGQPMTRSENGAAGLSVVRLFLCGAGHATKPAS